jgi:hypothetical protein
MNDPSSSCAFDELPQITDERQAAQASLLLFAPDTRRSRRRRKPCFGPACNLGNTGVQDGPATAKPEFASPSFPGKPTSKEFYGLPSGNRPAADVQHLATTNGFRASPSPGHLDRESMLERQA